MRWLILLILVAGCSAEKKISKAKATLNKYDAGSGYCATMFPCQDTGYVIEKVVTDTVTLQGEVFTITETVNDTVYITRTQPARVITRTVVRDSIIIRRDGAKEAQLSSQVSQLTGTQVKILSERDGFKTSAGKWRKYALITWVILLALLLGWIYAKTYVK